MTDANANPVLAAANITKSFSGKVILEDVSLRLSKGELKVLIGPSGSGKSTLLQCLNMLHIPDSGRVEFEGQTVNPKNRKELYALRRKVGLIFQDFNLFDHLSAKENVTVALRKVRGFSKKEAVDRAMEELARVGLADFAHRWPAELSGGQKQRVSIARALAMDPTALLLDEPTSALDPELVGEVLAVVRELAATGMTMVMATHQVNFAAGLADEFVFMDKGKVVESGSPVDLLGTDADSRTLEFCRLLSDLSGDGG